MSNGDPICSHLDRIEVTALPEKIDGCEECLKIGSEWGNLSDGVCPAVAVAPSLG